MELKVFIGWIRSSYGSPVGGRREGEGKEKGRRREGEGIRSSYDSRLERVVREMSRTASNYSRMSHKQHIMEVTDTYVGSDEKIPRMARVLDDLKIVDVMVTIPEAVEHLFIEILSNASDNAIISRKQGVDPGPIQVIANERRITVRNGGIPIPIELHEGEGLYAPHMIFGCLLTSSNYDKGVDRDGCGRNGYGAKLVNIFSKLFHVRIGDSMRGLEYEQTWINNMDTVYEPVITPYSGPSYVEITYELDFGRFGYEEYPHEALALFARHAADTSLSVGVVVEFNGIRFDFSDVKSYSKLLFDKNVKSILVETGALRVCLLDTPHNSKIISAVNGKMTSDGGVHVEAVIDVISKKLLSLIGGEDGMKLTVANLRPHLSLIVICNIANPKFSSQTKTCLKSPKPKFEIEEREFKKILKWDLVGALHSAIELKAIQALSKTNGKKSKHVDVPSAQDANEAGHTRSRDCVLYVVEGKSAAAYAKQLISLTPRGRDIIGFFPMKGKPLNVMNAGPLQISKNEEIVGLKRLLGLTEGLDYTVEKNFNTLRYGYFVILADSDDDGKHIVGLILNLFYCRFPSLLQRGYVLFMRTPILRASRGGATEKFYRDIDYEKWKSSTQDHEKWNIKYYKGLASSSVKDIVEDHKDPRNVVCYYDEYTPDYMALAFHSKLAEMRKQWIAGYEDTYFEMTDVLPISSFINNELIEYAVANVARSIPRFLDGLKSSQRKALWTSFDKWPKRCAPKESQQMKVSQFASRVSDFTDYRHGEASMCDTIVGMAQNYTGSNNIPYFLEDGQFGTRDKLGSDSGNPRYIYTRPSPLLPLIFRKEDDIILTLQPGDKIGEFIEPLLLLPIIPMQLINGALGIGTAWSTFIPNFNPLDVIREIRSTLTGGKPTELTPWYSGYGGDITLKIKTPKATSIAIQVDEDDPLGPDEEYVSPEDKISISIKGRFNMEGSSIRVTEIPIGRSIDSYREWLTLLLKENKISDYSNYSTTTTPNFLIHGWQGDISLRALRLTKTLGLTNMVMLDNSNRPMRYKSSSLIISDFVSTRILYYEARKTAILHKMQDKIDVNKMKVKFIQAVVDNLIPIRGNSKSNIHAMMDELEIPRELLKSTSILDLTNDEVISKQSKIDLLTEEYNAFFDTSPVDLWMQELGELEKAYLKYL